MTTNNPAPNNIQGSPLLSSHDLFRIDYERDDLFFDEYLVGCEDEILNIINDKSPNAEKFVNFVAEMNSGKTYSLMDIGYRKKMKMIIIEPLQIIALQKFKEYRKDHPYKTKLGLVHGRLNESAKDSNVTVSNIKEMLTKNTRVFLCVYDSLSKFFHGSLSKLFDPSEYVLVIDESHKLVIDYHYRSETIHFIRDVEPLFRKVIHLTGTPEGAIIKQLSSYYFQKRSNDINLMSTNASQKTINIVRYEGDNRYRLLNLLLNDKNKGLKIILIDNKNKLQQIAFALIKKLGDSSKVKTLNSALKSTDVYIRMTEREDIDPSIEYLFTTRVISDGANIRNRVASIYFVDINNNYVHA